LHPFPQGPRRQFVFVQVVADRVVTHPLQMRREIGARVVIRGADEVFYVLASLHHALRLSTFRSERKS
jgi:hypothetical protein